MSDEWIVTANITCASFSLISSFYIVILHLATIHHSLPNNSKKTGILFLILISISDIFISLSWLLDYFDEGCNVIQFAKLYFLLVSAMWSGLFFCSILNSIWQNSFLQSLSGVKVCCAVAFGIPLLSVSLSIIFTLYDKVKLATFGCWIGQNVWQKILLYHAICVVILMYTIIVYLMVARKISQIRSNTAAFRLPDSQVNTDSTIIDFHARINCYIWVHIFCWIWIIIADISQLTYLYQAASIISPLQGLLTVILLNINKDVVR